jgi:chitinase
VKLGIRILGVGVLCGLSTLCAAAPAVPIIVGYVFPGDAILNPGQIDAHNVSRINYAFATTKSGRLVMASDADGKNFALMAALKKENPSLSVLISVGGWSGSGNFSNIALTARSRAIFIDSVMDFLSRNNLDGLDVDWEYPGLPGAGHAFRPEDTQNFTLLLEELRTRFNQKEKASGRRLYLTIAAGASDEYLQHTEIGKVQRYVDAINLMAYDFNEAPSNGLTGHQSALFADPADPNQNSADASVRAFERAGAPAAKLILGVPFYGRAWEHVEAKNNGLFQRGKPSSRDFIPFNVISSTMIGHGFTRYWDAAASAAYLYSRDQRTFVSYEDSESLAAKCSYVLAHQLGGVMFWKYSDDPDGELLGVIERGLHRSAVAREP